MTHVLVRGTLLLAAALTLRGAASAEIITLGYVAFNATAPPLAEVDIVNGTGVNASFFPDTTFPVVTPVALSDLSLTVTFAGGTPSEVFGPDSGYFNLAADGLSFNGNTSLPFSGDVTALPGDINGVTLTGIFDTTILTLNDGSTVQIQPDFTARIPGGRFAVSDGDFGLIQASATPITATPEPGTWVLGLAGFGLLALRSRSRAFRRLAWLLPALLSISASAAVHLNQWTSPDSGVAGSANVWVTGSGFPKNITNVAVTLAPQCNAAEGSISALPGRVTTLIGTAVKVQFLLPLSLSAGTYFVQVNGEDNHGALFSSDCSRVIVSSAASIPVGCGLTSNILVSSTGTSGKHPVTAYVPRLMVGDGNDSGIILAPVEGPGSPSVLATPTVPSQCVANSVTEQVLCSAQAVNPCAAEPDACGGQTFDLIQGHTLLQVGPDGFGIPEFAINPATDQVAYISEGFFPGNIPEASYFPQQLIVADVQTNLGSTGAIFNQGCGSTSGLVVDPAFNEVFSASDNCYPNVGTTLTLNQVLGKGAPRSFAALDTSPTSFAIFGEDCATHVAASISTNLDNGSTGLVFNDLAQATYAASPSTQESLWSAPIQTAAIPEIPRMRTGAVVAGKNHLALIEDDPSDSPNLPALINRFGAILLSPVTGVADYAVFVTNDNAAGTVAGYISTYTSPNTGKDYAVALLLPDNRDGSFTLEVIDLKAALAAPRTAGTHLIQPAFDLVKNGVVRYVRVPPGSTLPPA